MGAEDEFLCRCCVRGVTVARANVMTLISVTRVDNQIKPLKDGPEHAFADWPVQAVPDVAAGVYAIWNRAQLIYVGMSGRGATAGTRVPDPAKVYESKTRTV